MSSRPLVIRNGLADQKMLADLQRPLEIDLEALFRVMEEQAIRGFLRAVESGQSPTQAITSVTQAITEYQEEA